MKQLVHYILIRRDIPTGPATAQLAHAAGESFYSFGRTFVGSVDRTIAVVLGVRDERELRRYRNRFVKNGIRHVAIVEYEGFLAGQMTAIGVEPTFDRESVRSIVKKLMPLQEFERPTSTIGGASGSDPDGSRFDP